MKATSYKSEKLGSESQELCLTVAGLVIRLFFEPAEQIYYQQKLLEATYGLWQKGGFLTKKKDWDFEIRFRSEADKMKIIERDSGKKHYYLTFIRDFANKKFVTDYSIGLPALMMALREVIAFLLERKSGLLLHASSCLDEKGILHIFLAPTGGGKTTVADLLSSLKIFTKFSDDLIIARKVKGKWSFFSPPLIEKDFLPTKRKAEKAKIYLVKKGKVASKQKIADKSKILKIILKQLWLRTKEIDKKTLSSAMRFSSENEFCLLRSTLDLKEMRRVINEN